MSEVQPWADAEGTAIVPEDLRRPWLALNGDADRRRRTAILDALGEPSPESLSVIDFVDLAIEALAEASARPVVTPTPADETPAAEPPEATIILDEAEPPVAEPAPEVEPSPAEPELPEPAPAGEGGPAFPGEMPGYPSEVELLYEDLIWLFQNGDTDGAMVSLERLLVLAPMNESIRAFVRLNEDKLLRLYEGVIGPWTNVPRVLAQVDVPLPALHQRHEKFKTILHLVNAQRTLGRIIEESYFLPLETCAVLNQLLRAKVITCARPEAEPEPAANA